MTAPQVIPPDQMMTEIIEQAITTARAAAILGDVTITDSEDAAIELGVQAGVNQTMRWLLDHGYIGGPA